MATISFKYISWEPLGYPYQLKIAQKFSTLMGWTLPSMGMWRGEVLPSLIAMLILEFVDQIAWWEQFLCSIHGYDWCHIVNWYQYKLYMYSMKQLVYYANVENIFAFNLYSDHNICVICHDVGGRLDETTHITQQGKYKWSSLTIKPIYLLFRFLNSKYCLIGFRCNSSM